MLLVQSLVVFEHSIHPPQLEEPDRFNAILRSFAGDI